MSQYTRSLFQLLQRLQATRTRHRLAPSPRVLTSWTACTCTKSITGWNTFLGNKFCLSMVMISLLLFFLFFPYSPLLWFTLHFSFFSFILIVIRYVSPRTMEKVTEFSGPLSIRLESLCEDNTQQERRDVSPLLLLLSLLLPLPSLSSLSSLLLSSSSPLLSSLSPLSPPALPLSLPSLALPSHSPIALPTSCISKKRNKFWLTLTFDRYPRMPHEVRSLLVHFYKDFNEELYKLLRQHFKWPDTQHVNLTSPLWTSPFDLCIINDIIYCILK